MTKTITMEADKPTLDTFTDEEIARGFVVAHPSNKGLVGNTEHTVLLSQKAPLYAIHIIDDRATLESYL